MVYVGFDPGKSGGISAIFEDSSIKCMPMPVIGKEYIVRDIVDFLKEVIEQDSDIHVGIENVHAIQGGGGSSNFTFGKGFGILIGAVEGMGLPYTMVTPVTWQKIAWQGVPVMTKGGKKDTKGMSLVAANRLYPNEKFLKSDRAKNPHDGMVDATHIAYYLRCTNR